MIISTLQDNPPNTRVAITPQAAKHYVKNGLQVVAQEHIGLTAGFTKEQYQLNAVELYNNDSLVLARTNILLCINAPHPQSLHGLQPNSLIVAPIDNHRDTPFIEWCLTQHISLFSTNLIPRISRAQSMDSLSSQANLSGYKAVIEAVHYYHRVVPMMMTAAGMIQPAKVLILGAGVAGLQAIATAKRLGAIVYAFDVRHAAKEQVESLGAEFIEVAQEQESETLGGYATEMGEEYKQQQQKLINKYASTADIIIATALIPGKPAPILLSQLTIEQMKPGSIVIDLATSRGGNCALSVADDVVQHQGVTIRGYNNITDLIPTTASELYANNLVHLINLLYQDNALFFNPEDEIIQHALLCHQGNYLPFLKN